MLELARYLLGEWRLPRAAKLERLRDADGLPTKDPGIVPVVDAGIAWLAHAQDASGDGGVARDYSLVKGWSTSYPETTGYIVPTMLDVARSRSSQEPRERARRMLDWLVSIQMDSGAFQGGRVDAHPRVPVTFNTGQILLGLAAGEQAFGNYGKALTRAADWLVGSQDEDGCWRSFPTPFAAPGEKAYETHVAWGLFEAERIARGRGYGDAGLKQVRWALSKQHANGWVDDCCLTDRKRPLTHALGYFLRGTVEAYRLSRDEGFLDASRRTANGLLGAIRDDGYLPGRLHQDWTPAVDWTCLTGSVQIAHSWLLLWTFTEDTRYLDAARRANQYVRRTVRLDGPAETRGGVKGSFPVDGDYGRFEFLNWAVKFSVDSNLMELELQDATVNQLPPA